MVKVPKLAIIIAIAGPLAVAGAAESSAAPINGAAIKAAAPAVTTDVRYRAQAARPDRDDPYNWNYPTYSYWGYRPYYYGSYPGYLAYSPYWTYPNYYAYSYGW
jgi:hypothetical protein